MLKTTAFSLAIVLFGAAATAKAGCNGSHCAAEPSCAATAQAAPADEHSNMPMPSARAPQGTRSFSYQPSTGYSAPRATRSQGWTAVRGAASKASGNY